MAAEIDRDYALSIATYLAMQTGAYLMRTDRNHSNVDNDCQEMILQGILNYYGKGMCLCAEENTPSLAHFQNRPAQMGEYRWIVDPLDGTGNFRFDNPDFSVSIGLESHKEPIVGVVYFPEKRELYTALKGDVRLNNEPMRRPESLQQVISLSSKLGDFTNLFPVHDMPFCASESIISVANGRRQAYVFTDTNVWDVAPSVFILDQLGGMTLDSSGAPLKTQSFADVIPRDLYVSSYDHSEIKRILEVLR